MWVACILTGAFFCFVVMGFFLRMYVILPFTFQGYNRTLWLVYTTGYYDVAMKVISEYIVNNITGIVPIVIVSAGSLVIGLKVARSAAKRKKLSGGRRQAPMHTTRTLLSFCIAYSFASGMSYGISLFGLDPRVGRNLRNALNYGSRFCIVIYCSCNFLIHFMTNPNFKDEFARLRFRRMQTWRGPCCSGAANIFRRLQKW